MVVAGLEGVGDSRPHRGVSAAGEPPLARSGGDGAGTRGSLRLEGAAPISQARRLRPRGVGSRCWPRWFCQDLPRGSHPGLTPRWLDPPGTLFAKFPRHCAVSGLDPAPHPSLCACTVPGPAGPCASV